MYTCIRAYIHIHACLCEALEMSLVGLACSLFSYWTESNTFFCFSLVGRNGGKFSLALKGKCRTSIKWQLSRNEKQSIDIKIQRRVM